MFSFAALVVFYLFLFTRASNDCRLHGWIYCRWLLDTTGGSTRARGGIFQWHWLCEDTAAADTVPWASHGPQLPHLPGRSALRPE